MQHFSHHWHAWRNGAGRLPRKTPATMPASGISFKKYKPFFEENAALPDRIGRSGVCKSEQSGLLLSIQFGYTLSWPTVFWFQFISISAWALELGPHVLRVGAALSSSP